MAVHVSSRCYAAIRTSINHSRAFCAAPEITWTANGFPYNPKDIAHLKQPKDVNGPPPISPGEMAAFRRAVSSARNRFREEIKLKVEYYTIDNQFSFVLL